jgi:hypothetical protein
MTKSLIAMVAGVLLLAFTPVLAGPHGGGYRGGGHHGGGYWGPRVGIYYGGLGYGHGYGYGYPYVYAPMVITTESLPQTLIQQDAPAGETTQNEPATHYWYYCTQPAGYFPYVQNCSQPWMKVVPQIPSNQATTPRPTP